MKKFVILFSALIMFSCKTTPTSPTSTGKSLSDASGSEIDPNSWHKAHLEGSSEGDNHYKFNFKIDINFEIRTERADGQVKYIAEPMWVNIISNNSGLLEVELRNYQISKNSHTQPNRILQEPVTQLRMAGEGTGTTDANHVYHPGANFRYADEVTDGFVADTTSDLYEQELSIKDVTGLQVIDPANGTPNFKFNLLSAAGIVPLRRL
jgi:hypothetical protein